MDLKLIELARALSGQDRHQRLQPQQGRAAARRRRPQHQRAGQLAQARRAAGRDHEGLHPQGRQGIQPGRRVSRRRHDGRGRQRAEADRQDDRRRRHQRPADDGGQDDLRALRGSEPRRGAGQRGPPSARTAAPPSRGAAPQPQAPASVAASAGAAATAAGPASAGGNGGVARAAARIARGHPSVSLVADGFLPDPRHRRVHGRARHGVAVLEPLRSPRPLRARLRAHVVVADSGDDRRERGRARASTGCSRARRTSSSRITRASTTSR